MKIVIVSLKRAALTLEPNPKGSNLTLLFETTFDTERLEKLRAELVERITKRKMLKKHPEEVPDFIEKFMQRRGLNLVRPYGITFAY